MKGDYENYAGFGSFRAFELIKGLPSAGIRFFI
jgi:hypothetical protein